MSLGANGSLAQFATWNGLETEEEEEEEEEPALPAADVIEPATVRGVQLVGLNMKSGRST